MPLPTSSREEQLQHRESLTQRVEQVVRDSHNAFRELRVDEENGAIVLGGRLPSFYLKQFVQTVAGQVEGVERLENRIEVVRAHTTMA